MGKPQNTLTRDELKSLRSEGNQGVRDLAKMAEALGYKNELVQWRVVSECFNSIISFLADNPGAIEAIYDWVEDYYEEQLDANDDE